MNTKTCGKCKATKLVIDFPKWNRGKDGLMSICKDCNRVRAKEWAKANKHTAADRHKRWADKNRDKVRENHRRWSAEARKSHKHCLKLLVSSIKGRAKNRGLEYDLDQQWILEAARNNVCQVTGIRFEYDSGKQAPWKPSVDRIDPNKGYVKDNCRLVVWAYNSGKGSGSDEDMILLAKGILEK